MESWRGLPNALGRFIEEKWKKINLKKQNVVLSQGSLHKGEEEKKDLSTELPSKRGTESREPSSSLSRTEELFLSDDKPIESGSATSAPEQQAITGKVHLLKQNLILEYPSFSSPNVLPSTRSCLIYIIAVPRSVTLESFLMLIGDFMP